MTIKQQEQLISDVKKTEQFKIVNKIDEFQKATWMFETNIANMTWRMELMCQQAPRIQILQGKLY